MDPVPDLGQHATEVLQWINARAMQTFTQRDVFNGLRGRTWAKEAKPVAEALAQLADAGQIIREERPTARVGRPSVRYRRAQQVAVDDSKVFRVHVSRATESGWSRDLTKYEPGRSSFWLYRWPREHQPGDWLAHCLLCKDRASSVNREHVIEYASVEHLRLPQHQRWAGRLEIHGELSFDRGYDNGTSYISSCGVARIRREAELRQFRVAEFKQRQQIRADDELAARRSVSPSSKSVAWRIEPCQWYEMNDRWESGRKIDGALYLMYGDNVCIARIIKLRSQPEAPQGGWLVNNCFVATEGRLHENLNQLIPA
jgi:hypothetical protein